MGFRLPFLPTLKAFRPSRRLLIGVAATLTGLMALIVVKIVQVRESPVAVGPNTVVGTSGVPSRGQNAKCDAPWITPWRAAP